NASGIFDPGLYLADSEADLLQQEVASINRVWGRTLGPPRIAIAGHSNGGLVAERWWLKYGTHQGNVDPQGVTSVYSLDSPINGVSDAFLCTGAVTVACTLFVHVGPLVADWYTATWLARSAFDNDIQDKDGNEQYIAIGTFNDPVYQLPDWPIDGMVSQLVFV